jgi:TolB-like protein
MSLSTGTRLGPYEIQSPLGAGGMGEVYRARDTRLDRDVALKVIHSHFAADADRLSRFTQEAKAAARLDHPNILVVHDVGSHEGNPYIVSELLEGESLREMLGTPLPPKKAVGYALEIARGLSAAHEKGIIHRDLKPENVFVTKDRRIKILDFGVAKLTQPSSDGSLDTAATTAAATQPGVVLGTVGYMSPEQVQGKPLDARSDIFSLGAVLYELLSGKKPFHRGTVPETLTAILREEPPDLLEMNKNIPPEVERIVRHCLEKTPEGRFQSAPDVVLGLEALRGISGEKPVAPMSAVGVLLHRHRAAVAAAALLIALALGAGWWWRTRTGLGAALRRVAVLPFENLTGDPEQSYLADGIHEALITDLARLGGLSRVIARASAIRYAKTTKSLSEVARELGVDAIITGSVLQAAGKVKVTAHLINAATDEQVWSDSFERAPRDILSLQNDIVAAIARKANLTLTPTERARLATARPVAPEAYEAFLKGKFQLNKMTPEGFEKGLAYLNQAVAMDPANPLPQAALAVAYARIGHDRFPDYFARARATAAKAQELGGEPLAEMYQALGEIKLLEARKSLDLDPRFGYGRAVLGYVLAEKGLFVEAIAEHQKAGADDPDWRWCLTRTYAQAGRKDEARKLLAKFLGEKPEATGAWAGWFLAETYAALGENGEAIRWLEACYRERQSFLPWVGLNPAYAPLRSNPRFQDLVRRMKAPSG